MMQRLRFFERRQVLALDVLDQRELDNLAVVDIADDDRQLAEADLNSRLVSALAGDDLKAVAARAHDQWLDDPLFGDRSHQLGQVSHDLPRLVRVRVDAVDGNLSSNRRARRGRQGLYVMLVVAHPDGFGEPSPRHGQ